MSAKSSKSDTIPPLYVRLRQQPVHLPFVGRDGHSHQLCLNNALAAKECVSAGPTVDVYSLEVRKSIYSLSELSSAMGQLLSLLEDFSIAWPVVTGHRLAYLDSMSNISDRYETNEKIVERALEEATGRKRETVALDMAYSTEIRYTRPPLRDAAKVLDAMSNDPPLREMLTYLRDALEETKYWYVPLYKAYEVLFEIHKGQKMKPRLRITKDEDKIVRDVLQNYNNRHRGRPGLRNPSEPQEVNRVKCIVRDWICRHLARECLPTYTRE